MRHQNHKYTLGVKPAHRVSMIKNLASELIDHGKIRTTHTRAKAVRSYAEKLVTLAKKDTVANRRQAFKKLNNQTAVKTLFETVAPKFKDRNGGYTRIVKIADLRAGDAAKMSFISFLD